MTDTLSSTGGTVGSTTGTGGTSGSSTPVDFTDLLGPTTLTNLSDTLSGGNVVTDVSSPSYDPSLFEPGGVYAPTGATSNVASAPQVAQAQQDPSGQIPDDQQQQQTVDRTGKGDRATTQDSGGDQRVDRTGKGDLASALGIPPKGPTGLGDAQQPTLAQLQHQQQQQQQQQPKPAQAQQPAPAAQPAPAPAAVPPQQPPAAPQAAPQRAAPEPQYPQVAGAPGGGGGVPAQGGVNPLQGILNALLGGGGGLGGLIRQLLGVPPPRGVYPTNPQPRGPTARMGPYGAVRGRQGDEQDTSPEANQGTGPAPGQNAEVTPPDQNQIRQTRIMGSDTPPTAGFSNYLREQRAHFNTELSDPRRRLATLAMMSTENEDDPAAVAESLLNRCNYANTSINNMLHSGFYGPINMGRLARAERRLQANPQLYARMNAGLETALRGANLLGGATDQGSFGGGKRRDDPNVHHTGGRVGRFGEIYNDWGGGPGGHNGAANWRHQQQRRVQQELQQGTVRSGFLERKADLGNRLAMDIGRRVPTTGVELDAGGGMQSRGGGSPVPLENLLEQRRKREQQRREAEAS